jgi:hypothetical protein
MSADQLHVSSEPRVQLASAAWRRCGAALLVAGTVTALSGCAVISVAGAAAGAAISVTGAAVSTTVKVTGKVIEKSIDLVTPSPAKP